MRIINYLNRNILRETIKCFFCYQSTNTQTAELCGIWLQKFMFKMNELRLVSVFKCTINDILRYSQFSKRLTFLSEIDQSSQ